MRTAGNTSIEAALIHAPVRAGEMIFGRPLLERLMLVCARVGVKRFFIQASHAEGASVRAMIGSLGDSPNVHLVESLARALDDLPSGARCVVLRGALVLSPPVLAGLIARQAQRPDEIVELRSTDAGSAGVVAVGPLGGLLGERSEAVTRVAPTRELPYALASSASDVRDAELRLARALRHESAEKDAPMARWVDRRLSWRISYLLARTAVTPNQVTVASATIGLVGALLFAVPGYW